MTAVKNNVILLHSVVLLLCITGSSTELLQQITSALCVKEYGITHRYVIADIMNAEVLMCRCDCDMRIAANYFGAAIDNFRADCGKHLKELRGFCQEVIQSKVTLTGCTRQGFAFCYNKLTAKKVYNFTTFDIKRTFYRITFDGGQTIESRIDQKFITINESKFKIYTYGNKCETGESFLRFYENIHDKVDKVLESCKTDELGTKFTHTRQFIITSDFSYHKKLWRRINYSKRVCVGKLNAFSFDAYENKPDLAHCKLIPPKIEFRDVNDTTAYLYEVMDVILDQANKKSDAITPAPTKESKQLKVLNVTIITNKSLSSNADKFSQESTTDCINNKPSDSTYCHHEYFLAIIISLVLVIVIICAMLVGVIVYCWRRNAKTSPQQPVIIEKKEETKKSESEESETESLVQNTEPTN